MKTDYSGLIFTFMWAFDMQSDWDFMKYVADKFEATGRVVYYVELVADRAVRIERNKSENRLKNKASKRDIVVSEDRMLREETKYRLKLEPGQYTLSYSIVGWKAKPSITCQVKVGTKNVGKLSTKPEYIMSENGSSARITKTTDKSIDFEVTASGNCILSWTVPTATSGLTEALVGNIRLVKNDEADGIVEIPLFPGGEMINAGQDQWYDLSGRKMTTTDKKGIYVKDGKKVLRK